MFGFLLWIDTISSFQGCSLYKHPRKDSLEKWQSVLLLAIYAETQKVHGEFFAINIYLLVLYHFVFWHFLVTIPLFWSL